jgi:SAM-dependent methyltransferase
MSKRQRGLLEQFGLGEADEHAWLATGLPDADFDEWLLDRVARRPSGDRAREVYGAEDIHDWARKAILDALALQPGETLLEIGAGGGLLLRDAVRAGAHVWGIDHSPEMVALARQRAPEAQVVLGEAEHLAFPDESFDAVAMSMVFFFLPHPVLAMRECRRVTITGGRLAIYTTAPQLRGTPAAPEPFASRGHFHSDRQLALLARRAELRNVEVVNRDGGQLLTARR